jgi:hypothetical protein
MKQNRTGWESSIQRPYFAFVFVALGQRASRKLVLASPGHRQNLCCHWGYHAKVQFRQVRNGLQYLILKR